MSSFIRNRKQNCCYKSPSSLRSGARRSSLSFLSRPLSSGAQPAQDSSQAWVLCRPAAEAHVRSLQVRVNSFVCDARKFLIPANVRQLHPRFSEFCSALLASLLSHADFSPFPKRAWGTRHSDCFCTYLAELIIASLEVFAVLGPWSSSLQNVVSSFYPSLRCRLPEVDLLPLVAPSISIQVNPAAKKGFPSVGHLDIDNVCT